MLRPSWIINPGSSCYPRCWCHFIQQVRWFHRRVPPLDAERGVCPRAGVRLRRILLWGRIFWHRRRGRQQQLHRRRRQQPPSEARARTRGRRPVHVFTPQTIILKTAACGSCVDSPWIPRTEHGGGNKANIVFQGSPLKPCHFYEEFKGFSWSGSNEDGTSQTPRQLLLCEKLLFFLSSSAELLDFILCVHTSKRDWDCVFSVVFQSLLLAFSCCFSFKQKICLSLRLC